MTEQHKAMLRSFLTTFLSTLLTLIPVTSIVEGQFEWVGPALLAAGLAAVRTVVAALDPGMPLFGLTKGDDQTP
jgi:heme/copper-type cytochrome/quinol oxidase subunit 4